MADHALEPLKSMRRQPLPDSMRGHRLRNRLQDLSRAPAGMLRYCQGWYHFPAPFRAGLQAWMRDSAGASGALYERLAWYHQAAGTALAPYVLNAPVPGLAGDRAFLPENVHEATYHFATGFSLAQRARARLGSGETGERQRLVDAIYASGSRQLRFATTASWMTVVNLTKLQRLSEFSRRIPDGEGAARQCSAGCGVSRCSPNTVPERHQSRRSVAEGRRAEYAGGDRHQNAAG